MNNPSKAQTIKQSESETDKTLRRHRRAERNKIRTIRHIHKLLDTFQAGVLDGFFNEEVTKATAEAYRKLSPFLTTNEYTALGNVWRDTWTTVPDQKTVQELINTVKKRIEGDSKRKDLRPYEYDFFAW